MTPKRSATLSRAVREGWVDGAAVSAGWHDDEFRTDIERRVAHLATVKAHAARIGEQQRRHVERLVWRIMESSP